MLTKFLRWWLRRDVWCGIAVIMVLLLALLGPPVGWLCAIPAAMALAAAILRWPAGPVSLAIAASAAAGVSLAVDLGYPGPHALTLLWMPFEIVALWALMARVVRRVPDRQVVAVAAVTGAAVLFLPLRLTLRLPTSGWAESVVGLALALFPAACAVGVGLYLRSLDRRRERSVVHARRQQRLEVASDLHDFVAHDVMGIVLEAQAARVSDYDPEQTRHLLARIEEAGLRALDSMDHTVQALRSPDVTEPDDQPSTRVYGLADLAELVERFAAGGTVRAELAMADSLPDTLGPEVEKTVYAVVLEALTNIRRHAAGATAVAVSVTSMPGPAVSVSVTNDGGTGSPLRVRHGGGTGLAGLVGRTDALGGSLTAGPQGTGWQVLCVLPVPTAAPGRSW
ncbi:sensor histidine kinase [Salinispora vitiensis]|uniref:sensor histidine kinase n=1 Tax=Salinispora vitiensis TaxID=999544 RepID=UPI00036432AE|nr:histidine kinase [Salinispora vitiensis]